MRITIRRQSHLLPRKSYKPVRFIRIQPIRLKIEFSQVRFGAKPEIKTYECKTDSVQFRRDGRASESA